MAQIKTLAFIDSETTSLRSSREAWDIGIVRRSARTGEDERYQFYVDVDLANADPKSLEIGRYYERHPNHGGTGRVLSPADAAAELARLTRWSVLVGLNPAFDQGHLEVLLERHGITPTWHYTPVDLKAVMLGWLAQRDGRLDREAMTESSDVLAARCGIELDPADRHTALGDARLARDLFDRLAPR